MEIINASPLGSGFVLKVKTNKDHQVLAYDEACDSSLGVNC